jgi:hypothetical protein
MKLFVLIFTKYGWAITVAAWMALGGYLIWTWAEAGGLVIGTMFLIDYAAFSLTGLLGFMMGMETKKADEKSTNLQEIAGWLTKLLLGAGLVELKSVSKKAWEFSQTIGDSMGRTYAKYEVFSGLIAFSALGILAGYLWSQLHYGNSKTEGAPSAPPCVSPPVAKGATAPIPQGTGGTAAS